MRATQWFKVSKQQPVLRHGAVEYDRCARQAVRAPFELHCGHQLPLYLLPSVLQCHLPAGVAHKQPGSAQTVSVSLPSEQHSHLHDQPFSCWLVFYNLSSPENLLLPPEGRSSVLPDWGHVQLDFWGCILPTHIHPKIHQPVWGHLFPGVYCCGPLLCCSASPGIITPQAARCTAG